MQRVDDQFKQRVYEIVKQIPKGRVMTYGQIAALCGSPLAAKIVGGVAHWGDPSLPWQRVVMKDGSLATGVPGGTAGHANALKADGVITDHHHIVDFNQVLWRPNL